MGLHARYTRILGDNPQLLLDKKTEQKIEEYRKVLTPLFTDMMSAVFNQKGAQLDINIIASPQAQALIGAHAGILDSSFKQVEMSEAMRRRLSRSNHIFSGMKVAHELNEGHLSLLDENGNRKPFERFLNDVRKIDKTYNKNYLQAEYQFIHSSAIMAAKWEEFSKTGDRYLLRYRTVGDNRVRPAHAALHGVTLPMSDPFWEQHYPPNGWRCRCDVVQVRRGKYPVTDHDEAMALGEEAMGTDTSGMFRFNPGIEKKTVPDYNPYTLRRCRDCDLAKGKVKLARSGSGDNETCYACVLVNACYNKLSNDLFKKTKKDLKNNTPEIPPFKTSKVDSGVYYQSKTSFKLAIGHAKSFEELDMYVAFSTYIDRLIFIRKSPLGEGKDLSNPKDEANLIKKRSRGVSHYNTYILKIDNGDTWQIKTEVRRNKRETIYHLYKKK